MAEPLDPKELVTVEDLAISSMWEIAALVEGLERKGVLAKEEMLDLMRGVETQHTTRQTVEMALLNQWRTSDGTTPVPSVPGRIPSLVFRTKPRWNGHRA